MNTKGLIVNLDEIDLTQQTADIEGIRKFNPQRHQMEHLTAVIYEDTERHVCVGYKDVTDTEFWIEGHMPGMPLMPGVIMCEAAAQLASFYTQKHDLLGSEMVGFGGLENVRFREPVQPGDRLYVLIELQKVRRGRMIVSRFQGIVNGRMAFDGVLKGIPLPIDALKQALQRSDG